MGKEMRTIKNRTVYILAFLATFCIFHVISLVTGIGIYGDRTVLKWDAIEIYVNFFAYLMDILKGNTNEIFYTLSIPPGNSNTLLVGWFLFSPFNLILLLFDKASLPDAYFWIECIKLSTASFTMSVFLTHQAKRKNADLTMRRALIIILLCLGYSYGGFVAGHTHELLYFDSLIMLPLVADGLYKLYDEGKVLQYFLCLFYVIATNFYFGFMTCIFSVLFFIYVSVRKKGLKHVVAYIITSVLAGASAAFVLLPVLYQIPQSKLEGEHAAVFSMTRCLFEIVVLLAILLMGYIEYRIFTSKWYEVHVKGFLRYVCSVIIVGGTFGFLHVVINKLAWKGDYLGRNTLMPLRLLTSVFRRDDYMPDGLMNVYVGLVVTLALVAYFADYRVEKREKFINFGAITTCFLMMGLKQINMVWHGFTFPAGSFHRWAFFISFMLIMIVADYCFGLEDAGSFELKKIFTEQGSYLYILAGLFLLALSYHKYLQDGYTFLDKKTLLLNAGLIAIYVIVVVCASRLKNIVYVLFVVLFAELVCNAVISVKDFEFATYAQYDSYMETSAKIMQEIRSDGAEDEYRTESAYQCGWWYISGYHSLYHIGSAYTSINSHFMQLLDMGLDDEVHGKMAINNFDLDPKLSGFMGIKFLLPDTQLAGDDYELKGSYTDEWSGTEYFLYQNKKAIPLALHAPSSVRSAQQTDLDLMASISEGYEIRDGETGLVSVGPSVYESTIVCNDNETVMWTLPYDKGWEVYVDGVRADASKAFDFFLSADVSAGTHTVKIKYVPPYIFLGLAISCVSILLFVLFYLLQGRKLKKERP